MTGDQLSYLNFLPFSVKLRLLEARAGSFTRGFSEYGRHVCSTVATGGAAKPFGITMGRPYSNL